MPTMESNRSGSQDWDPAVWSIAAALAASIVYLACLS